MKYLSVRLFLLFCGLLSLATFHAANAQGLPTTITVGGFFPNGGHAEHYGGATQLSVEARYGFPVSVPLTPTRTVISVAGEFGNSNGGHSNIIPITIGEYFGASGRSPFASNNFFAGIGIGGYVENISGYSNAVRVGGYGTVGYNFTSDLFVDAKYQEVEHGDGAVVGVGLRF